MKRILFYFFLFIAGTNWSQTVTVKTKVAKDSIAIKWIPTSFEQFKEASKGAKVTRIESNEQLNFETLNFSEGKEWIIEPAINRIASLDVSEAVNDKMVGFIQSLDEEQTPELKEFITGVVLIENIVNPRFQYVLGNILVDKNFSRSKSYVYRIEVEGWEPIYASVDASKKTVYPTIDEFELNLDQQKTVDIVWNEKAVQSESFGFDIEHSMGSQKEGIFLTEDPFLPFTSDSEKADKRAMYRHEAAEGEKHFYRVIGRDAFGVRELYSEWKEIYVPKLIYGIPVIDTIAANGAERIIEAKIVSKREKTNVEKVLLLRSSERTQGYEEIDRVNGKDSTVRFVVDGALTSGDSYYYIISLISKDDTVNSVPHYFFTLDQEPPSAPSEVLGKIDSAGIVSLNWNVAEDLDIQGYRVFRGNEKRGEFIEQTKTLSKTPLFLDTLALNNLTSEVYYYVISVDENFNQSVHSDTLLLMKPDTIAPVPAVIRSVKTEDFSLVVSWINSDSQDVAQSVLLRNKKDTVLVIEGDTQFVDSLIEPGKYYNYQVHTVDKGGNRSISNTSSQFFEPGFRKELTEFNAEVKRSDRLIELSWNAPNDEVYNYQMFRMKQDGKLRLYKTIEGKTTELVDKNLEIGTKYTYSIKYITSEGIHSFMKEVTVVY